MRALISVYDKTGLLDLARELTAMGWEVVSSGGTSKALAEAGVEHSSVESVTGAKEMLGGRVKTLHPKIHGGILADRSVDSHMDDLEAADIVGIDLVVCNLYPFRKDPSIEMIDIGGPTMVRAAAKNHAHVGVVVDPIDYSLIVEELKKEGALRSETRAMLARKAFAHTASYDAAIVAWFDRDSQGSPIGEAADGLQETVLPETIHISLQKVQDLRYGENPHQSGARYADVNQPSCWDSMTQHSGLALSYLNIFDAQAAWELAHEAGSYIEGRGTAYSKGGQGVLAAAIIKHANPCGLAIGASGAEAYKKALECDPVSAFGGIVAFNFPIDDEVATAMVEGPQADVVVAPSYTTGAIEKLVAKRKNTRLIELGPPLSPTIKVRMLDSSALVQNADVVSPRSDAWKVVSKAQPTGDQWEDLALAWLVCARTTSNAIVVTSNGQAIGIGAGQQNRMESAHIAVGKAGEKAENSVAASDAFFPFRDGFEVLAKAGVKAVISPGGSIRDQEIVDAADEFGVALVMTGERHFRH